MHTDVVVLAAGKGTRMQSNTAKVLHQLAGKSLIHHVLETARTLKPRKVAVVIGHQGTEVQSALSAVDQPAEIVWVEQAEQLGTGHAVKLAKEHLPDDGVTLVLYGDVPLISQTTLEECEQAARIGSVGLVVAEFSDPAQLGRIVRDDQGAITAIVEFKDASDEQRKIQEINSGIIAAPTELMSQWLDRLQSNNAQQEYYLTDIIAMAVQDGVNVVPVVATSEAEVTGINDRVQLAELERTYQQALCNDLMLAGASFADPSRVDIRGKLVVGRDCFIDANVVFEGDVELADEVTIGPGCVITNTRIGTGTQV
ncbi:MAG: NTP transferase domain-containing protein, partial [Pseudomonadota bacterium]|nr:NTP transferase domain-containing protein [Pseudomonadota bacterium]